LIKKLFLSKDSYQYIACHRATVEGNLEALEKLGVWVKKVELNTDELLLVQTGDGYTAFLLVAQNSHVETLNKLWGWAEETQQNQKC